MSKKHQPAQEGTTEAVPKKKKPFYKRVWFWILIVIVAFVAIGSQGGSESESTASSSSSSSSVASSTSSTESSSSSSSKASSSSSSSSTTASSSGTYDPDKVSDEKIKAIETYGDYLDMYGLIFDDYVGYYQYKLEQYGINDPDMTAEFEKARQEFQEEWQAQKDQYSSMKDIPLSGVADSLAEVLITTRDTYRQAVDTTFAAYGG